MATFNEKAYGLLTCQMLSRVQPNHPLTLIIYFYNQIRTYLKGSERTHYVRSVTHKSKGMPFLSVVLKVKAKIKQQQQQQQQQQQI